MAVITYYWSTSAAGSGDGTSWANRAALLSGGSFSGTFQDIDHGADTILHYVGPGTYNISVALNTASFSEAAPGITCPAIFHACDSSGNAWSPPSPNWCSAEPVWDTSTMPVFAFSSTGQINLTHFVMRGFVVSQSGTVVPLVGGRVFDWCVVSSSYSNAAAQCINTVSGTVSNTVATLTGATNGACLNMSGLGTVNNCRCIGNPAASAGNRSGLQIATGAATLSTVVQKNTIINCTVGINCTNATGTILNIINNVVYNCTTGIAISNTTVTAIGRIAGNMIIGSGSGSAFTSSFLHGLINNRLRGWSTNFPAGFNNWPASSFNITASGSDADEFVNVGTGDYRIKATSTYAGKQIGAGDEVAAGASGIIVHPGFGGGFRS